MPFQLNARHVFLTYPRCDITKENLLQFLTQLFPEAGILVGHELHADEGHHLHALISNPIPIRLKGDNAMHHFDYLQNHPNIQSARNLKKVFDYVSKCGDTVLAGEITLRKKKWDTILEETLSTTEFMDAIKEISPRDYILNHERLQYFTQQHFKTPTPTYIPKTNFAYDFNDLDLWLDQIKEVF